MSTPFLTNYNNNYRLAKTAEKMYKNKGTNGEYRALQNDFFGNNPAYSQGGAFTSLSEGASYGMLFAYWANDFATFNKCWAYFRDFHRLSANNLASAKDRQSTWNTEYMYMRDRNGNTPVDNGRTELKIGGWVYTENKAGGTGPGLASTYVATDGDLFVAYLLLRGYERWGQKGYLTEALGMIADLAQYCVKQCGSDFYLIMGGYRDQGGFELPAIRSFTADAGSVFPVDNDIIVNDVNLTTGDQVRFKPQAGATLPAPFTGPTVSGATYTWQKYYTRINGSFNQSFYPTRADAIANTNEIDITTTGSGGIDLIPMKNDNGVTASDPSYMKPEMFRLFAKYDTANAALWNNVATKAYDLISASMDGNYWKMPTYLWGVNTATGAYLAYTGAGEASDHHPDAWRVFMNMAMDGSTAALNILKKVCTEVTPGVWNAKTGLDGGIWRYYLDNGRLPNIMRNAPSKVTFEAANVDTTNDTISNIGYGHSDNSTYSNPVMFFSAGTIPAGLTAYRVYFLRNVYDTVWTVHPTLADALAGTNKINITSQGTGTHSFVATQAFDPANVDTTTDTIKGVAATNFDPQYSTWGYKNGDAVRVATTAAGTLPAGLSGATTYYFRWVSHTECSLHPTATDAINGTNKVNITSQGTGVFMLFGDVPQVTWFARYDGGGNPIWQDISPYGAMQVAALKLGLNGKADAQAWWDTLPAWIKGSDTAMFNDDNPDYYLQYLPFTFNAMMGMDVHINQNEQSFVLFTGGTQSANLTSAQNLINTINTSLSVTNYGKPLKNTTNNTDVAVLIRGKAFNALDATQKTNAVPILPTATWVEAA